MKAKFATLYCFTVLRLASYFSETFSKSLRQNDSSKETGGFDLRAVNRAFNMTKITTFIKTTPVPNDLTGYKFAKITQTEKDQFTNVTGVQPVKKDDKFHSKLSQSGDYVFGSLLLLSCKLLFCINFFLL